MRRPWKSAESDVPHSFAASQTRNYRERIRRVKTGFERAQNGRTILQIRIADKFNKTPGRREKEI